MESPSVKRSDLRRYYETCELWLPEQASRRLLKLKLEDGGVVKRQVSNVHQLRKVLLKYLPVDVWYSSSKWLNPTKVWPKRERRGGYLLADNLWMGGDVPFDIDGSFSITGLDAAKDRTRWLVEHLPNGLVLKHIRFTGTKGFQIICEEKARADLPVSVRLLDGLLFRNTYISKVPKNIIPERGDREVTTDLRRVIRLPLSARSNGFIATPLKEADLSLPIQKLVNKFLFLTQERPRIPMVSGKMTKRRDSKSEGRERSGPSSPLFYSICNDCGKRQVPILKYHEDQEWSKDLNRLCETYSLGPIAILEDREWVWIYGIQTFAPTRMKKFYKASRAVNRTAYAKYGRTFLTVPSDASVQCHSTILHPANGPISKVHKMLLERITNQDMGEYKQFDNHDILTRVITVE